MRPNPLPPHHYWIMKLRSNYTQSPTSSLFGYHFSYPRERRHDLPLTTHHLPRSAWAPWQSQDSRGIYCKAINIMVFIVDLQLLRRVVVVAPAAALLSPLMLFAYTCARVRQTQNQQTMRSVIIHTTSQPPPPLNPTSFSHGGWKWRRPLQIHSNPPSRYSTFPPIPSRWQWDTCRSQLHCAIRKHKWYREELGCVSDDDDNSNSSPTIHSIIRRTICTATCM